MTLHPHIKEWPRVPGACHTSSNAPRATMGEPCNTPPPTTRSQRQALLLLVVVRPINICIAAFCLIQWTTLISLHLLSSCGPTCIRAVFPIPKIEPMGPMRRTQIPA